MAHYVYYVFPQTNLFKLVTNEGLLEKNMKRRAIVSLHY